MLRNSKNVKEFKKCSRRIQNCSLILETLHRFQNRSHIRKMFTYSKTIQPFEKVQNFQKNIHEFGKYLVIQYFSKFKNVN